MEPDANLTLMFMTGFAMCGIVPLGLIVAVVCVINRRARLRHEERMAMITQGLLPPPDGPAPRIESRPVRPRDPTRGIEWAVGLLVVGVLWCLLDAHFASLLIGCGAVFLTRGIIGLRRDAAARDGSALPPGDVP